MREAQARVTRQQQVVARQQESTDRRDKIPRVVDGLSQSDEDGRLPLEGANPAVSSQDDEVSVGGTVCFQMYCLTTK